MKADLHVHSYYSDGSDSVEKIMQKASQNKLTHISFVDHDTVDGWSEKQSVGQKLDIQVIPGIEISAYDFKRHRKVHILGYQFKPEAPNIKSLCNPLLQRRQHNSLWQMEQIRGLGYELDTETITKKVHPSPAIYKQHIMKQLTEASYTTKEYKQLYKLLFKGNGIAARDIEYVDVFDAVQAIVADGGVAVLAHPGQLNSYELAPELADAGLKGIELIHPDHTKEDHQRIKELSTKHNLILTGGTDYHGTNGIDIQIGDLISP
ncbi:PHP domain-containing protein [Gracilibacillus kekensis]|uniref:Polymerase/histidinol phosphatase N-terminal domain-containing protein n=1 Tax=Gracilibacillus kekensis TaxID=1027249 RepID=A0A1M7QPN1_9BACI|nr:PHP domain-containing protein [Gracilibacillus kekensis]SHN33512.1 hypothetical protein SAMN05216179_3436 [Gracilibacillus kekensis]